MMSQGYFRHGKRRFSSDIRGSAGFSLTELLVAMAVGLVMMAAMVGVFSSQNKSVRLEHNVIDTQGSLRLVVNQLDHVFSHAGFGCSRSFQEGREMTGTDPLTGSGVTIDAYLWDIEDGTSSGTTLNPDSVVVVYGHRRVATVNGAHSLTDSISTAQYSIETFPVSGSGFGRYLTFFPILSSNEFWEVKSGSDWGPYTLESEVEYVRDDAAVYQVVPVRVMVNSEMLWLQNFVFDVVDDWELAGNVEDLQIQYSTDGTTWTDSPSSPNSVVGIWYYVLIRGPEQEAGYVNDNTYELAGQTVGPFNDGYPRQLSHSIVWVRN